VHCQQRLRAAVAGSVLQLSQHKLPLGQVVLLHASTKQGKACIYQAREDMCFVSKLLIICWA
jgi:hypothetical protein